MNNPFIFGEIVKDDDFCDREAEQKTLLRDLRDSQKIFLISPRRYGKTSLLKRVLKSLEAEDVIPVYLDLYRASSLRSFLELYCAEVATAAESVADKALRFIRDVLPRLRPKLTIDAEGTASIGLEPLLRTKELTEAFEETLELPALAAERKGKKVVVVFDEFQEIAQLDGKSLEKTMRSHIQEHRNVGYVFSGSKKHLLDEMARGEERAFYKIGKILYLDKIPRAAFIPFLRERFSRSGFEIVEGVLERVLERTDEVPYNVQFVCHELWDRHRDGQRISIEDVDRTISVIIEEQSPFFIPQWDALSLNQRAALAAIVTHGGTNIFSQEFLKHSGISSLATLQTSLKLLAKKGVVEKVKNTYAVSDVFFREWIRKTTKG